jgi:hypothetical protein
MTNGFNEASGDTTPANSPSLFKNFTAQAVLQFSVSDDDRAGYAAGGEAGPDGAINYQIGHAAELGIGEIQNTPVDGLLGVFLTDSQPNPLATTPAPYDFREQTSRDYLELKPQLNQPFYIGNGRTTEGLPQKIFAPVGATRLFLGITDGSGWYNNVGFFDVDITVPPLGRFALTFTANPPNGGAVETTPVPDADGQFSAGTVVNLTGYPYPGFYLQGWSDIDSFGPDGAVVTMTGPRVVSANFKEMNIPPPFDGDYDCFFMFLEAYLADEEIPFAPITKKSIRSASAPADTNLDIPLLRAFRDQTLARTITGQRLINLFYTHSPELIFHAFSSSLIRTGAVNAVTTLQPYLRDMLTGTGEAPVSASTIELVKTFFASLNAVSGVALKSAILTEVNRIGTLDSLIGKTTAQVRLTVADVHLQLVNPKISSAGSADFILTGILPTGTFHAEYSEDLLNWVEWTPSPQITTLPATLHGPLGLSTLPRFYRVRVNQ